MKATYNMYPFGLHWNTMRLRLPAISVFFSGSRALFTGPAITFFSKNNFKTRSHSTIYTFKNYFATVFSVFSNKQYPNKSYTSQITSTHRCSSQRWCHSSHTLLRSDLIQHLLPWSRNRFVLPLEAKSKKYKENHLSVYLLGSKSKSMK